MPRPRDLDLQAAIGARLREIRKRAGWTQEGLAEKIEVSPNNISHYERGKKSLTIATLASIARALNVRLAELVDVEAPVPEAGAPPEQVEELKELFCRLDGRDQKVVLAIVREFEQQREAPK
jgi:transcriptional regulator with XRE-family HTH domain